MTPSAALALFVLCVCVCVYLCASGSRRYGRILQDNGDGTYDILVDRVGGEGAGQYRTDSPDNIGPDPPSLSLTCSAVARELAASVAHRR